VTSDNSSAKVLPLRTQVCKTCSALTKPSPVVRLRPDQKWQDNPRLVEETQKVETELGQTGRVLIRASGTEPLVRVMVEARDSSQAESCARRIATTLQ